MTSKHSWFTTYNIRAVDIEFLDGATGCRNVERGWVRQFRNDHRCVAVDHGKSKMSKWRLWISVVTRHDIPNATRCIGMPALLKRMERRLPVWVFPIRTIKDVREGIRIESSFNRLEECLRNRKIIHIDRGQTEVRAVVRLRHSNAVVAVLAEMVLEEVNGAEVHGRLLWCGERWHEKTCREISDEESGENHFTQPASKEHRNANTTRGNEKRPEHADTGQTIFSMNCMKGCS